MAYRRRRHRRRLHGLGQYSEPMSTGTKALLWGLGIVGVGGLAWAYWRKSQVSGAVSGLGQYSSGWQGYGDRGTAEYEQGRGYTYEEPPV